MSWGISEGGSIGRSGSSRRPVTEVYIEVSLTLEKSNESRINARFVNCD